MLLALEIHFKVSQWRVFFFPASKIVIMFSENMVNEVTFMLLMVEYRSDSIRYKTYMNTPPATNATVSAWVCNNGNDGVIVSKHVIDPNTWECSEWPFWTATSESDA